MKKQLYIYLLLFISSTFLFAQTSKVYHQKAQRKTFYSKLSTHYNSPTIQKIWISDSKNEHFDQYVDEYSERDLLKSYATVIHELLHSFNNTKNNTHNYFIEKGIQINVPFTSVYNSKELNKMISKNIQDSIFRYGLYVGGKSVLPGLGKIPDLNTTKENEVMSIQLGIYGLLEEFSAYYFGNLAIYEMYEYYLNRGAKQEIEIWKDYKAEVQEEWIAYYEFQLFISWYLIYAKKNYPTMYKQLYENNALRIVYTLIEQKYATLLKESKQKIKLVDTFLPKENDILSMLDFSNSEEDFIRFIEFTGLTPSQVLESPEIKKEMRKQYSLLEKQIEQETGSV